MTAIFCPVRELSRLDFPTLLRPTNATSGSLVGGGLASNDPRNFTPLSILFGSKPSMLLLHDALSSRSAEVDGSALPRG